MTNPVRISSIDIMRGLTLLLMLFVNDLNMKVAPAWLGHTKADFDGMGLADWVFPGFLFIVGMAIPFALSNRLKKGDPEVRISLHILTRTLSLLIIGVLMLNTGRVNPELTGMSKDLWALMMYVAVFFVWNDYPIKSDRYLKTILQLIGVLALALLAIRFRSGQTDNPGWMITGWWGILGLIGWGYLTGAFTWLFCRDSILKILFVTLFFFLLNILSGLHLLGFLDPVKPVFGILLEGNVPFIVLTGVLAGVMLRNHKTSEPGSIITPFLVIGIMSIIIGFILRNWFIISKIHATPSWGMICNGISFLVFILIYWLADVKNKTRWASFVKPAGQYSLTTYLAPDILYHAIWMTGIPLLLYKQSAEPLVAVFGSLAWALLMVGLTAMLARINIKLRL
jgi:predicted acyltransferase